LGYYNVNVKNTIISKLNFINKQFYKSQANSFSQTRQSPWAGWRGLIPYIKQIENNPIKVLDIGCGNGRFGQFLKNNTDRTIEYTGTDNSYELLKIAQINNPNAENSIFTFLYQDLVSELLDDQFFSQHQNRYDLIVLFGILHHIPSLTLRKRLLNSLGNSLNSNGLLVFTVWRFGELNRFADKLVNPKNYSIDPQELEPGDYLVDWRTPLERQTAQLANKKTFPVRYAHAVSTQETTKLLQNLPPVLTSFLADGKDNQTNHYWVVKK